MDDKTFLQNVGKIGVMAMKQDGQLDVGLLNDTLLEQERRLRELSASEDVPNES